MGKVDLLSGEGGGMFPLPPSTSYIHTLLHSNPLHPYPTSFTRKTQHPYSTPPSQPPTSTPHISPLNSHPTHPSHPHPTPYTHTPPFNPNTNIYTPPLHPNPNILTLVPPPNPLDAHTPTSTPHPLDPKPLNPPHPLHFPSVYT